MISSILRVTAVSAVLWMSATATFAGPVPADLSGVWRTADGDGLVAFRTCGDALCGYVVDDAAAPTAPQTLLIDRLTPADHGWSGGRILDPRNGRSYVGEIRPLDEGRLKVTGCLVRPLCGSQIWNRVR
jgi:uncharacterized protein (DUF2147 family)